MIVCSLILTLLIPGPVQVLNYLDYTGDWFFNALTEGVNHGLVLTAGNIAAGGMGAAWACLALLIAAYAIPSWTDVRVSLRGAVVLALMYFAICALVTVAGEFTPQALKADVAEYLEVAKTTVMTGLYSLISCVSLVATVSMIGIFTIQIAPAVAGYLVRKAFRH